MTKYGYARVSSDTQDYRSQVEALKASGCKKIYSEKASGKSTNGRPELAKVMKALHPGDTVVVTKLDRFARSIDAEPDPTSRKLPPPEPALRSASGLPPRQSRRHRPSSRLCVA